MLQGVPPYKEAYNMKLPGTYVAYSVIMAVFGQSAAGIHIGLMLVNAVSVVMVFLLGRKLLDEVAGVAAAVSFALLSLSPSTLGLAAHASHFVVFFALAGILALTRAASSEQCSVFSVQYSEPSRRFRRSTLFVSGLLFGTAFVMDQHGAFFMVFGGAYLVYHCLPKAASDGTRSRRRNSLQRREERRDRFSAECGMRSAESRQSLLTSAATFGVGCVFPYLATCLILWLAGVFPRFVFWTISYAAKYAGANPLAMAPEMLREALQRVVGMDMLLWLLPWVGALVMWQMVDGRWEMGDGRWEMGGREGRGQTEREKAEMGKAESRNREVEHGTVPHPRFFLTALLLCSIAAVSIGYYFRAHYFILMLTALSLLSGVAVSRGWYLVKYDRSIELFLAVPILGLFLIGIGAALIGNGDIWFRMTPAAAVREIYGTTLFSEAREVADYLKSRVPRPESKVQSPELRVPHSALRTSRIAVIGSEPEIYFYCHGRSATGYLYTYPLMEVQPFALKMQEEMISEIETNKPEFVIYVNDDRSWLRRSNSEKRIDEWWEKYWTKNLDLVKTISVYGREGATEPAERKEILILKRRE
jgi:hypothetical protein